jgi:exonuclease SbcD
MTRVIHTGDTHIGYQQYHSPERRRDFLDAFRQVVADAIDDDVDAVVHAGDLFHDRRPGLADLQGTVAALRDLAAADIPFLAVVGNHEGKRDGQWLDLFSDLDLATRLDDTPYVLDDTAFYGLDFVPRSQRDDLAYDFAPTDASHRVLVSHGLFEPFAHADWDTDRLLDESSVDFDALLLGDNHAPGKREVQDTWVTYCGSTERASASEREDRGYNIVTVDDDGVQITRRGLDVTRDFVFVDVELADGEGVDRVREQVRQHDLADAVVVVGVDGDGEEFAPAAVEELARDEGALVARVTDRRDVETDREVSVSFADPDDAVRERVRDLGLSEAARSIDETVRASGVADSNVREQVERRVRDLVDDADAFQTAADDDATGDGDEAVAVDAEQASEDAAPVNEDAAPVSEDEAPATGDAQPDEAVDEPPEAATNEDGTDDSADDQPEPAEATPGDDQASMEEYL